MNRPSPTMLRELTDESVLRALIGTPVLTRAEIAAGTGLSKPTVSESVRRLEALGLVADTGRVTHGRGGVGTYYALAPDAGVALVVSVAPEGIVAELLGAGGPVLARAERAVRRPVSAGPVERQLVAAVGSVLASAPGPVRATVVSAADPVDRATGRLVQLPDSPFLLGALSPAERLGALTGGPVLVDNDVNWAARAERDARPPGPGNFVLLHLGEGLGGAVVADGEVRRGHGGLAGEISHLTIEDAHGRACAFIDLFGHLGLRQDSTTAIDVDRLLTAAQDPAVARVLARAVGGVLTGAVAFLDPELVVLGGPWGSAGPVLDAILERAGTLPRRIPVEPARVSHEPSLTGARSAAHDLLTQDIVRRGR